MPCAGQALFAFDPNEMVGPLIEDLLQRLECADPVARSKRGISLVQRRLGLTPAENDLSQHPLFATSQFVRIVLDRWFILSGGRGLRSAKRRLGL